MAATSQRTAVVSRLWDEIQRIRPGSRILIGLDGFDGAGKTYLADELAEHARSTGGRAVARVSIDGFHLPRAVRRAAGDRPEGFYRASYRYADFRRCVVDPMRSGVSITPAIWDVSADAPVEIELLPVPHEGVVIVDGIFLQRPELADVWDATVWVDVPLTISVPRGNARFPGPHDPDPEAHSNHRYVQGQRIYLDEVDLRSRADWILDNSDLARPHLRRAVKG